MSGRLLCLCLLVVHAAALSKVALYQAAGSDAEEKPSYLEIRSSVKGTVRIVPATYFRILVNLTSPDAAVLNAAQLEYQPHGSGLLLQISSRGGTFTNQTDLLSLVYSGVAVLCFLSLIASVVYAILWFRLSDGSTLLAAEKCGQESAAIVADLALSEQPAAPPSVRSYQLPADSAELSKANGSLPPERPYTASSSRSIISDPGSKDMLPKRRRRQPQKSGEMSSSDELSSTEDSGWTRQKALWKLHREASGSRYRGADPLSDLSADATSADAGFSSANESTYKQRSGAASGGGSRRRQQQQTPVGASSQEDLEWDGTIPMELSAATGDITHKWYFSDTEDEKHRERKSEGMLGYSVLLPPVGEYVSLKDSATSPGEGTPLLLNDDSTCANNSDSTEHSQSKPERSPPPDDGYETGHPLSQAAGRDTSPLCDPLGASTSDEGKLAVAAAAATSPATGRRGGNPRPQLGNSIFGAAVMLGLVSGAYCLLLPSQLTVDVTVFLPESYIRRIYLFANASSPLAMLVDGSLASVNVYTFETAEPLLTSLDRGLCRDVNCGQHCDERTGTCVCGKGYVLQDGVSCADIFECIHMPCGRGEKCINTVGSYRCVCADGYMHNSTGSCVECSLVSCPAGTYEVQACPNRRCEPCTTGCPDEHYVAKACSPKADTQCALCSPPCDADSYNYVPCTNKTDRVCRPKKDVAQLASSSNAITEPSGRSALAATTSDKWYITPNFQEQVQVDLRRSSDIQVLIQVHAMAMHPRIRAVDHSTDNDNEAFGGDSAITDRFCPFPLAVKHDLLPVLHANVTAAMPSVATAASSSTQACLGAGGKPMVTPCTADAAAPAVNPAAACSTYKTFGQVPSLHPRGWSVVCADPDTLPDTFDLASYLSDSRTVAVPPSSECAQNQALCDRCIEECAKDMAAKPDDEECGIVADDADDGWSPRLMHCSNCCLETKCQSLCAAYANRSCSSVRCWNGNLAEFVLMPSFHVRPSEYMCHVELANDHRMMELDYTIIYRGNVVGNYSLTLQHSKETVTGTQWSDGLLSVHYSTGFSSLPDIVQGDFENRIFSAGSYRPEGQRQAKLPVGGRIEVVSARPFDLSISQWKQQKCSSSITEKLFVLTTSKTAYKEDRQLSVEHVANRQYEYQVANRSAQPYAYFELQQNASVVRRLFLPAEINPSSVEATVFRQNGAWKVSVKGQVRTCPGRFSVRLWEDEVRNDGPLSEHEVGIRCPNSFSLSFSVPGDAVNVVDRIFVVELGTDERRIFVPAAAEPLPVAAAKKPGRATSVAEAKGATTGEPRKPTTLSVLGPFLLVNGIGMFVLGISWIISVIIPRKKGAPTSPKAWKAICLVCYAVYKTLFATLGSFTVFFLLWYTFCRQDISQVQSYDNALETVIARQRNDLQLLVDYSLRTVEQQNAAVAEMRNTCYSRVTRLHELSQLMLQNASVDLHKRLASIPQENDLVSRLQERMRDLGNRLQEFRNEYNTFAKRAAAKVILDMKKTMDDLENSQWLAGARILHKEVEQRRTKRRDPTRSFRDWLGLKSNLDNIRLDFTLPNFPSFDPASLYLPELAETPEFKPVDLDTVFLSTNHFFSDESGMPRQNEVLEEPQTGNSFMVTLTLTAAVAVFMLLDIVLLAHRTASAVDTIQLILTGRTVHKVYSSTYDDGCSSEKVLKKKLAKKKKRVRHHLFKLIVGTDFIPKLVGFLIVMSASYIVLDVTLTFVTMPAIEGLGLLTTLMGPWNLTSSIASSNIELNMRHINTVEIPEFQSMYNEYIGQVEYFNALYRNVSYQKWRLECDNTKLPRCNSFPWHKFELPAAALTSAQFDCRLNPVEVTEPPVAVITTQDVKDLLQPFVDAVQSLVATTVCMLATYATAFLLADMLGTILWNFLTRLGALPGEKVIAIKEEVSRLPCNDTTTSHIPFINE